MQYAGKQMPPLVTPVLSPTIASGAWLRKRCDVVSGGENGKHEERVWWEEESGEVGTAYCKIVGGSGDRDKPVENETYAKQTPKNKIAWTFKLVTKLGNLESTHCCGYIYIISFIYINHITFNSKFEIGLWDFYLI